LLNTGFLVSIWLINHIYSSYSQHLIDPLSMFLQWLSVRIVFVCIVIVKFIWLFFYSTKVTVTSKLIIHIRFRNNINLKIPNASILLFSLANLESFFLPSNTFSIIFHFRPPVFFYGILYKSGILINLTKSVITLSRLWWK